jgi:hypothetical protein
MNNLFDISSEEKNRILNLHESATKRQYLTLEQVQQSGPGVTTTTTSTPTTFLEQKLNNYFKFGEYQSESAKKSIMALKPKIEEFIKKNGGKQFVLNISAGESNVTNPKGFETKGSLGLARANSVKQYFEQIFPDLIKNGTLIIKSPEDVSQIILGKTPYDKTKGDNKNPQLIKQYTEEQFVKFNIQGGGDVDSSVSICKWVATTTGTTGEVGKNYVTTDVKLNGEGDLTFGTGSIPDRLIVVNDKGGITQDTGYIATKDHQYSSFKYVPLYVANLTKLNKTVSVSGSKIITIQVKNFNDLMTQILLPGVSIPDDKQLISMSQTEVYNGVNELEKLVNRGVKEFVIYTISSSEFITIPFSTKLGDSRVISYSPVGKTGYSLTGNC